MKIGRSFTAAALVALTALVGTANAQTTAASGTVIVLPLAAYIPGAYTTTVFVRNPNISSSITINIRYYQSDSATPAGDGNPLSCGQLTIPANLAVTFDLGSQCTFAGTDNFGQIILEDAATPKVNTFFAYSRTESPTGNGFSVEGFPIGNFSAETAESLGLKKTTTAPHYRSNCFVAALGESVNYQIVLFQGETGAPLGSLSGTLGPFHSVRILDVFVAAGVPGGPNFANIRAKFTNSSNSAMIGFCTLETSDNGSADFRVAKSADDFDLRQARLACSGVADSGATLPSVANPAVLVDPTTQKNVHYTIFDQPDFVTCNLVAAASTLSELEITLRAPDGGAFASPAPYNVAPYMSGGSGQKSFVIYTGEKSTVSSGATTRWFIDVQRKSGSSATGPMNYGIVCRSGNGVTIPWFGTTAAPTP